MKWLRRNKDYNYYYLFIKTHRDLRTSGSSPVSVDIGEKLAASIGDKLVASIGDKLMAISATN
jgi:hypothetical protein